MKRGSSGRSLLLGINKPEKMSSHDVVNRVRRCFGEKRVGHTGTLDPLACGVLPILVGPATRLSDYLMGHDKVYRVTIKFGQGTTTDDAEGEVIREGSIPGKLCDKTFVTSYLESLIGCQKQLPPSYSAIKVNGKKAYNEARAGNIINLEARPIEVYRAELESIVDEVFPQSLSWDVIFHVSKGTYIRSLARDIGFALGCPAHVGALQRLSVGNLLLSDCVGLDTLDDVGAKAALDPVKLLNFKFAFIDGGLKPWLENGRSIALDDIDLHVYKSLRNNVCACSSGIVSCDKPLTDGEYISMICDNTLKAIYSVDRAQACVKPVSIFQIGVDRGGVL